MSPTAEAVEKGAALLDEYEPDWAERIDVDALDLSDPDACVIGQVFYDRSISGADYCFGLDLLADAVGMKDHSQFATDYGFDMHNFADLQRMWSHQIAIRT